MPNNKKYYPRGPAWLAKAIFYEIYPQSFCDSNGDGIGDIPGIISKLDYIQSLGVNALWINPWYVSPFLDAGYDVADYCRVAPRYGTNNDAKRLFRETTRRDMHVLLDLVPGHTSIEHPWFKASCKTERNCYSDYYIWTNHWTADAPEMRTVSGFAERNGTYMTNFFYSQPALNYGFAKPDPKCSWQHGVSAPGPRAVRDEILRVMRFWLTMGASGFRVDMAASLVKKDTDGKAMRRFWQAVRFELEPLYPEMVLLSEWGAPAKAIAAGFHLDFLLHCGTLGDAYTSLLRNEQGRNVVPTNGYSFCDAAGKGDITAFIGPFERELRAIHGHGRLAIASGNHDLPRLNCRRSPAGCAVALAAVLTLPAVPFIYYGDEIGMRYQANLVSKEGGYNRTGSRTPMQWTDGRNAGFSTAPAQKLYLPVDMESGSPNVAAQEKDETSLLNQVRRLTALRLKYTGLFADGEYKSLYAEKNSYPYIFQRRLGNECILVVLNPAMKPVQAVLNLKPGKTTLLVGSGVTLSGRGGKTTATAKRTSYGVFRYEKANP